MIDDPAIREENLRALVALPPGSVVQFEGDRWVHLIHPARVSVRLNLLQGREAFMWQVEEWATT